MNEMLPLLYRDLVDWYRLVDPPADHAEEASVYLSALERAGGPSASTLLELGAGAGHNASYLKRRFRCMLTDVSREMLALSLELNPECEHVEGDMRSLRLGRMFDAVFVHDAIMYMTTERDLRAAINTAAVHTRAGGVALFAPDSLREEFRESSQLLSSRAGERALEGLEWKWDPDPNDDTIAVDYAFLLRDRGTVRAVHDRHVEGLFAQSTWLRLLEDAGYIVETIERPLDDGAKDEVFLCRRR